MHCELLSLSPGVHAIYHKVTSTHRLPPTSQSNSSSQTRTTFTIEGTSALPYTPDESNPSWSLDDYSSFSPFVSAFANILVPPLDALVAQDLFKDTMVETGKATEAVMVAQDSSSLCCIWPMVTNHCQVESILDLGCQIVTMSKAVAVEVGLIYDPTVVLHMQSVNGQIDHSLGLAHNILFMIGDIPFYLQVHILCVPVYDMLLGHPFNILTKSVVQNFSNEQQSITIKDPNSDRVMTVPTRVCLEQDLRPIYKRPSFHHGSMN